MKIVVCQQVRHGVGGSDADSPLIRAVTRSCMSLAHLIILLRVSIGGGNLSQSKDQCKTHSSHGMRFFHRISHILLRCCSSLLPDGILEGTKFSAHACNSRHIGGPQTDGSTVRPNGLCPIESIHTSLIIMLLWYTNDASQRMMHHRRASAQSTDRCKIRLATHRLADKIPWSPAMRSPPALWTGHPSL